jgi:hypothetical protein
MTHTAPTPTAEPPQPPRPGLGEMLIEVIDLSGGLVVALLPLFVLSVPGLALFVVLPALLLAALAAPFALIGAVLAAPYLLVRRLRGRAGALSPPARTTAS